MLAPGHGAMYLAESEKEGRVGERADEGSSNSRPSCLPLLSAVRSWGEGGRGEKKGGGERKK